MEVMDVNLEKNKLDKQVKHVGITISIYVSCYIIVSLSFHFVFSFSSVSLCVYDALRFNHLCFKI